MCVYVLDQDEFLALDGHNHRGRRVLVERDYFVYGEGVIVLLQVENRICLVQYVERCEFDSNELWDVIDADVGYAPDVEAVYLAGQRGHLLEQRYAEGRMSPGTAGFPVVLGHVLSPLRPIYWTLGNYYEPRSTLLSDI